MVNRGGQIAVSVTQSPKATHRTTHVARFERLFRSAAGLDVDKEDLRRYEAFLDRNVADLLERACEVAMDHARRLILPSDLPITKGLAACIEDYRELDEELNLGPVFERLGRRPQLELEYDPSTLEELPDIIGGMTIALARSFKIIDPNATGITTTHWERAFALFDLVW